MGQDFSQFDQIIEDMVVATHKSPPQVEELIATAEWISFIASKQPAPNEDLAVIVGILRQALGTTLLWEKEFVDVSAQSRQLLESGKIEEAVKMLRDPVRLIATTPGYSQWKPLKFFGYDDIVNLSVISKYFMNKNEIKMNCQKLSDRETDEAVCYANRIHKRLI